MSLSHITQVARTYPCPRCGRDRHGLEAPCQPCAWQPPPPDRKSLRWEQQHHPDTLAWQEAQAVLTAARYVATAGSVALCWVVIAFTMPGDPLRVIVTVALAMLAGWRFSRMVGP